MVYLRFLVYRHSDLLQKHNVASYHLHYLFFILFQYQPILRQFPHLFQWFRASCVISCRILARIETHGQKHWHEMDEDDMYYSYFLFFFFVVFFCFCLFIFFPSLLFYLFENVIDHSRHTTLFQALQDVYTTLITSYRRLIIVETSFCVYWNLNS